MAESLQCPSCGGPNPIIDGQAEQSCTFCGTTFKTQEVQEGSSKIKPKNDKVYNWMLLADTAIDGGDNEEAITYYNKILEEEPAHAAAWFGKGSSIIYTSKIGDIKMSQALTYYKNAIKFGKGKEMKTKVVDELNTVVSSFYPNIKNHYEEFSDLEGSVTEFYSRFSTLEAGLTYALTLDPDNELTIDNGMTLVNDFATTVGFTYFNIIKPNEIKEKYVKEKKRLNPDWEDENMAKTMAKGAAGCFVATATMGNYDHPSVLELRAFRDNYLQKRDWGKKFTTFYYSYGPYPANLIAKSNFLRLVSYLILIKPLTFIVKTFFKK